MEFFTTNLDTMSPKSPTALNGVLFEDDAVTEDLALACAPIKQAEQVKFTYLWELMLYFAWVYISGLYGVYLLPAAKLQTVLLASLLLVASTLGVTAGVHRLWSHRSYKAKWPLQLILVIFQTLTLQQTVINWARDHRMHHKYCETDADPHNSTRGFFFAHHGWLFVQKHPEYLRKSRDLQLADLTGNPFLYYQQKYYAIIVLLVCFVVPTLTPVYFWNESWTVAFFMLWFRYLISYNATHLVNSAAHTWGSRPFDKTLEARDNSFVNIVMLGEAFHNYHHTFPWDYKASELGNTYLNFSTMFIDFFAKIGWAYDLKTVSDEIVRKRVIRTGDGSHPIWGWGDKDQSREEMNEAIRTARKSKKY